MKYWDSSAIVPLVIAEEKSAELRDVLSADREVGAWLLTPVEVVSALWRRRRAGELDGRGLDQALMRLDDLERSWVAVVDASLIASRARRLLAVHGLRSADALQLAAALILSEEQPQDLEFVTLDERLADAARREGFRTQPDPP
jgi:predicted nucleic acid-binding protein